MVSYNGESHLFDSHPSSNSPVQASEPAKQNISTPEESTALDHDLDLLIGILPPFLRSTLTTHPQLDTLIEIVLDLGRLPEARFLDSAEYLSQDPVTHADLEHCIKRVGTFGGDNRAGIGKDITPHQRHSQPFWRRDWAHLPGRARRIRHHWHDPRPGRDRAIHSAAGAARCG